MGTIDPRPPERTSAAMTETFVDSSEVNQAFRRMAYSLSLWAFVLVGLALLYLTTATFCVAPVCGENIPSAVNVVGQLVLMLTASFIVLRMILRDTSVLWTPAAVYPASTAVYFGFGNMAWFFASELSMARFSVHVYSVTPHELLSTNFLTMIGVLTCVLTMVAVLCAPVRSAHTRDTRLPVEMVALGFLGLGLILKYLVIMPSDFGLVNWTLPGAIKNLQNLPDLGLAIVAYLAAQKGWHWALLFWLIWPLHLAMGILDFAKTTTVLSVMLPAIGAFLAHRDWKRLLPWLLLVTFLVSTLQSVNTVGRDMIREQGGASFRERVQIVQTVMGAEAGAQEFLPQNMQGVQVWWFRLSYAGAQARAMDLYDSGQAAQWLQSPLIYFIPRLLWSEKPVMQAPGTLFNQTVYGDYTRTTRVGISVYADGYWQMGWGGVILYSALMGSVLGVITRFSYFQVASQNMIYLPAVFLGISLSALSPTGFLQNSVLGALPIYVGYLLLIRLSMAVLRGLNASGGDAARYHTSGV